MKDWKQFLKGTWSDIGSEISDEGLVIVSRVDLVRYRSGEFRSRIGNSFSSELGSISKWRIPIKYGAVA